jgi:hypothetical protein
MRNLVQGLAVAALLLPSAAWGDTINDMVRQAEANCNAQIDRVSMDACWLELNTWLAWREVECKELAHTKDRTRSEDRYIRAICEPLGIIPRER